MAYKEQQVLLSRTLEMVSSQIIIVNYNAGEWLTRSLRSALKYSTSDITVVDNCSHDNSVQFAQGAIESDRNKDRVNWLLNKENRGFAAANNQVLSTISSDYAVLLNPDCELQENTLRDIFNLMQSDKSVALASCRILNEDGTLQATCRRRFPTPSSALARILLLDKLFPNAKAFRNFDYGGEIDESAPVEMVEAVSGAFMVVRRSAMESVGLLDEDYFMHCEDLDWCKRFHQAGLNVAFVPKPFVIHAKGISSSSRPIAVLFTLHKGMNRFFDKFYKVEYAWPIRYLVKVGIALSFALRATKSVLANVVARFRS